MLIERLIVSNFRCFGPAPASIPLDSELTCQIGSNGSGKTAALQALVRLFGISGDHRRVRPGDFHIANDGIALTASARELYIEAILGFPELSEQNADANPNAVPDFFRQVACNEDGTLRCRIRLDATWTDDGTVEGAVDQKYTAIRNLSDNFDPSEVLELHPSDRARIQVVYVPAVRDGASQVAAFLRSRLWKALKWSAELEGALQTLGSKLNDLLASESGVKAILEPLQDRWQEIHTAGTDSQPRLRSADATLEDFARHIDVVFHPDEYGRDRPVGELSDGQRSLFHLAMTSAVLDVEHIISTGELADSFNAAAMEIPSLTVVAVEEPENSLSPFYLSRITRQLIALSARGNAQAVISSHSSGVVHRVKPEQIRYFRRDKHSGSTSIRCITLPTNDEVAEKYIRQGILTYPELYFAQFVVLGEGSSEETVLPRLAQAKSLSIEQSFVPIVPLGGRHMHHLWRLLLALEIPHATLLDLDIGRAGGGIGRIKVAVDELIANGVGPSQIFTEALTAESLNTDGKAFDRPLIDRWATHLRSFGIFYCTPLDLDMSMLTAYPDLYQVAAPGGTGPSAIGDAVLATLGPEGDPQISAPDLPYAWYRYLFSNRSKPASHLRSLGSATDDDDLKTRMPQELSALIEYVAAALTVAELPARELK